VNVTKSAVTRIAKARDLSEELWITWTKVFHLSIRSGKPSPNSSTTDLNELVTKLSSE
jgi:hypothetical protein